MKKLLQNRIVVGLICIVVAKRMAALPHHGATLR